MARPRSYPVMGLDGSRSTGTRLVVGETGAVTWSAISYHRMTQTHQITMMIAASVSLPFRLACSHAMVPAFLIRRRSPSQTAGPRP